MYFIGLQMSVWANVQMFAWDPKLMCTPFKDSRKKEKYNASSKTVNTQAIPMHII